MLKSIKFKIWLHMIGVVSVILIIIWLLGVVFLQNFYEFTKEHDVKKVQKQVVTILSQGNIYESYENIWDISRDNDMFIEVYDNEGDILITPFMYMFNGKSDNNQRVSMDNMMTTLATSNIINEMINNSEDSKIVKFKPEQSQHKKNSPETIMLIDKLTTKHNNYYIASRTSLMPVQATSEIVSKIFTILLFFVLLVSFIVAITFASSVTKPIRLLSAGAKQVAAGNYDVCLPIASRDEIGILTEDFNEMIKELGKVDSVRKDLIANVSHELRTPLTMIKGYAETIRDLSGDIPEKREKQLEIIIDESNRLSGLIASILDLSQLQAGKLTFENEEVNISKMVEKLIKRYDLFKEQGYEFNLKVSDGIVVNGDYSRLEQVICNLVDNAVNHSIEKKKIDISLDENGRFTVRNFGDIIEEENIRHIWDRYYKIDKTGNRRVTGTGIGLSIVKEILLRHGFKFGVLSDEENGTRFWVEFKEA